MKILKLKSILFSLIAISMLTIFLTSCEEDKLSLPADDIQKSEIPAAVQHPIEEDRKITFYLPASVENASKETIELYLANLTAEQVKELEESYKIEKYLESINRGEEIYNDLGQPDMFTLSDLSKYISEQELADFNSFDVNSVIESRGCDAPSTICEYLGVFRGDRLYRGTIYQRCCTGSVFGGSSCHTKTQRFPLNDTRCGLN